MIEVYPYVNETEEAFKSSRKNRVLIELNKAELVNAQKEKKLASQTNR